MKEDGGPAFPVSVVDPVDGETKIIEGMTLRDYFAAKAMQGLIIALTTVDGNENTDIQQICKESLEIADTMLREREPDEYIELACVECGKDYSNSLEKCPHCGNEIPF